jgi:hypothetical protein
VKPVRNGVWEKNGMYCKNCAAPLRDGAKFCPACGAKTEAQSVWAAAPAPAQAPLPTASPAKSLTTPRKKGLSALMLLVGALLIFIGAGHMALAVAGKTVTAQVTGYEQRLFLNNDESTRNPSRYRLDYAFSADGKRYTGSVTRVFSGGSQTRKALSVRYLPFWPHINAEDSGGLSPVGLAVAGAGVLLIGLAATGRPRVKNKRLQR